MNSKTTTKNLIITLIISISWILYFFQSYKLFSQIPVFITPGSSYIIKILEFTNYRPKELSYIFLIYFVLISICTYIYSFIYKKSKDKNKILGLITLGYLILFSLLFFISTIFLPIYIGIALLSNILVITSFYIANTLWGANISFEKDDVIYKSEAFNSEIEADKKMNTWIKKMGKELEKDVYGEVFSDNDSFYFEIYALHKVTLDRKGESNFYEDF